MTILGRDLRCDDLRRSGVSCEAQNPIPSHDRMVSWSVESVRCRQIATHYTARLVQEPGCIAIVHRWSELGLARRSRTTAISISSAAQSGYRLPTYSKCARHTHGTHARWTTGNMIVPNVVWGPPALRRPSFAARDIRRPILGLRCPILYLVQSVQQYSKAKIILNSCSSINYCGVAHDSDTCSCSYTTGIQNVS